jgi:hypothetical protein
VRDADLSVHDAEPSMHDADLPVPAAEVGGGVVLELLPLGVLEPPEATRAC